MPTIPQPLWTYTFIALTCLCGLIPYLLAWFLIIIPRKRKSLSIEIIDGSKLIQLDHIIPDHIKIACDGELLENPHLTLIKITNDGDLPIKSSDYEAPIEIAFAYHARLLNATLVETKPALLPVAYRRTERAISLKPVKLKKGDSILLKLIVSDDQDPPYVIAKIKGIPPVYGIGRQAPSSDRYNILEMYFRILLGIGLGMLMASVVFFAYSFTLYKDIQDILANFQFTVLALVMVGGLCTFIFTLMALLYESFKRRIA
jgi:hypothetical protein